MADKRVSTHVHRATRYKSMGKPASVYVTCRCGEYLACGTWWDAMPEGWDSDHWKRHGLRKATECEWRWARHTRRLRLMRYRKLCRRAQKAGRTPDEQYTVEHQ